MCENKGLVEATLTDDCAERLRELFNCEIEMLQGEITKLPNGLTRYKFEVPEEKCPLIEKFCLMVISNSQNINYN